MHTTFIKAQGALAYRAFCTCGWSGTLGHELDAAKEAGAHEKADVEDGRMQGVDCWKREDGLPRSHGIPT